jgi:hypothetical protein
MSEGDEQYNRWVNAIGAIGFVIWSVEVWLLLLQIAAANHHNSISAKNNSHLLLFLPTKQYYKQ